MPRSASSMRTSSRTGSRRAIASGIAAAPRRARRSCTSIRPAGTRRPAFDHVRLAAALSEAAGQHYEHTKLPFDRISFTENEDAIRFDAAGHTWTCNLDTYACIRGESSSESPKTEVRSPDGIWIAFVRDHNLFLRETATGNERQITTDGEAFNAYGALPGSSLSAVTDKYIGRPLAPALVWSPDGDEFLTYRLDERAVRDMHLQQSVPTDGTSRPALHAYRYPLPGDEHVPLAHLVVIDAATGTVTPLETEAIASMTRTTPFEQRNVWWSGDSARIYAICQRRGNRSVALMVADAATGAARTILEEGAVARLPAPCPGDEHERPRDWRGRARDVVLAAGRLGPPLRLRYHDRREHADYLTAHGRCAIRRTSMRNMIGSTSPRAGARRARSVLSPPLPLPPRRERSGAPDAGGRRSHRYLLPFRRLLPRYLLARRSAACDGAASGGRHAGDPPGNGGHQRADGDGLAATGAVHRQGTGRCHGPLRRRLPSDALRSGQTLPGAGQHLSRATDHPHAAKSSRAAIRAGATSGRIRRSRNSASSSSTSTAWARRIAPRRSSMPPTARTSARRADWKTTSSGCGNWRRAIPRWIWSASASTAIPAAASPPRTRY